MDCFSDSSWELLIADTLQSVSLHKSADTSISWKVYFLTIFFLMKMLIFFDWHNMSTICTFPHFTEMLTDLNGKYFSHKQIKAYKVKLEHTADPHIDAF